MSTFIQAAVLGTLQGLTEFLPVSSTAHLLIAGRLIRFEDPGGVFTVMIQLGSILAVMWLYRAKIAEVLAGLPRSRTARRFASAVLIAFLPAALTGAFLADYVETVLFASVRVMAVAFILGGVVMLAVERFGPRPSVNGVEETSMGRAMAIGVCQTLALIPGVSRSGATIVGGMVAGLERAAAVEFSFFLAMPTMVAAFVHGLLQIGEAPAPQPVAEIAVGFVTAFASAALVVKPFVGVVRRSGFAPFAWYRIATGVIMLAALEAGWS